MEVVETLIVRLQDAAVAKAVFFDFAVVVGDPAVSLRNLRILLPFLGTSNADHILLLVLRLVGRFDDCRFFYFFDQHWFFYLACDVVYDLRDPPEIFRVL